MSTQPRRRREDNLTNRGRGRRAGVPNRRTAEIKAFATEVLESPAYVTSLWRRIKNDELAPAIEALLYYYSYGKPREHLEIDAGPSLISLVTASLQPKLEPPEFEKGS